MDLSIPNFDLVEDDLKFKVMIRENHPNFVLTLCAGDVGAGGYCCLSKEFLFLIIYNYY